MAINFEYLEQNEKAVEYYTKEIEISPNNSKAYNYLGNIYVQLREFDKAREIYNKLIRVDDKNAQNYIIRAQFFMTDIDDYSSSISDLTKAIELEIDNSDFYFTRAQAYFKIKDFKNAIYDFEKALELNPEITNSEYIYSEIAKCYVGIGDFEKALENYNMEINLGENALAYSERAIFYDSYLNDFEKANLDFKKAIELAPNTNNIILQYLNFLYSNKKYEQALEISKKAREIEPKDPQSDFVSGLIYMETNKPFQTLKYLNSCIDKIIKYSGEGYWISDRSNSKVDLSEVFLMRGNFYKDKDKELMCSDYEEALTFTFDENQKAKINSLLLENCGI
jgi:tetratricopeptide (TPR) repeat protein